MIPYIDRDNRGKYGGNQYPYNVSLVDKDVLKPEDRNETITLEEYKRRTS